ncbi:ankyrin repeat domain-containing protein [Bordetella sp. 15P40C-2]|uniref:ankyrin repeat domain-containing protein n=1 Tax=Bordetella sp. 15P40C-2 TaxID=2572246 RepID=UPI0013221028|nr:ankyrin repeat domain-containing protein [Bordetella sp. 15P40C-2]MVW72806.1 hypothetical protein [Bordetella sp. 15P40C-2]
MDNLFDNYSRLSPAFRVNSDPSSEKEDCSVNAHGSIAAIRHAIRDDDVDAFIDRAMRFSIDIGSLRFEGGRNCLHLAMECGSTIVVRHLLALNYDVVHELVNARDDDGMTPLEHSLLHSHIGPCVVDHLCGAGAPVSYSLAKVLQLPAVWNGSRGDAVQTLIRTGPDLTEALAIAVENKWPESIRLLTILGAPSSEALVRAAIEQDTQKVTQLTCEISTVRAAISKLAKADQWDALYLVCATATAINVTHTLAVRDAFQQIAATFRDEDPVRHANALRLLTPLITSAFVRCKKIAEFGNTAAIKALLDAGKFQPQFSRSTINVGNLRALRTMITAGVPTGPFLRYVQAKYRDQVHSGSGPVDALKAFRLLACAGADISSLPEETLAQIAAQNQVISNATSREHDYFLLDAALKKDVAHVKTLIDKGGDWKRALKGLSEFDKSAVPVLIDAGVNPIEALVYAINEELNPAIEALIETDAKRSDVSTRASHGIPSLATRALIDRLQNNDETTARRFIPAITDGAKELVYAALAENEALARTLVRLNANATAALVSALNAFEYEAAGKLISWKIVDLGSALRLAIDMPNVDRARIAIILYTLGAPRSSIDGIDIDPQLLRQESTSPLFSRQTREYNL